MKYHIFFGKFGTQKGYVICSGEKNDFQEIYSDIDVLLKTIRGKDKEAMISLKFLSNEGITA